MMVYRRQVNTSLISPFTGVLLVALLLIASCTVPKKFQANKPFVFQTRIDVRGNIKLSERIDMEARLFNQLDDSLKVKVISFAGIRKTLISPAVFDTIYPRRSITYMNALLNSMGYFQPQITWDSSLRVVNKQQRVTVSFVVMPGKILRLDSIDYVLSDTALQRLADENRGASLLKKGNPYSQQVLASELDRLIDVYKDNGYYNISKEDLYAEHDTVAAALINPGLDPFETVRLLEQLRLRRENPTINVVFKQRTKNPSHVTKYTIGKVSIYPDVRLFEDTANIVFDSTQIRRITIFSKDNLFKPRFLARHTNLLPGRLYKLSDYYKTVNTFSQLGAWEQVNVELTPNDSAATLDAKINLFPAKKYYLLVDLEATRSSGLVIATSNLFGLGFSVGLRNRNFGREAIQSTTNIRAGIELGTRTRLIQTLQGSIGKTYYIQRLLLPFNWRGERRLNSARTVVNGNASYTDRRDFFTLESINGSFGYEIVTRKNRLWAWAPINLELVRLNPRDSLLKLFKKIPNLEFAFNNGLVIGQNLVYQSIKSKDNKVNTLKARLEISGALSGLIKSLDEKGGLFRFAKLDVDFRHLIKLQKSQWAFRAYGGIGVPFGKQENGKREIQLPFFKSFFAGGPNSMRGWLVRRLGPGSTKFYATDSMRTYDRFGDVMLEGNVEFRFNVATIWGVKLKSALFTDLGNIWNRSTYGEPNLINTDFKFSRLYKDLAIASGTSLRFDFDYFLIRFDWAYKLKDPVFSDINNGWFHDLKIGDGQFQLGINYPF